MVKFTALFRMPGSVQRLTIPRDPAQQAAAAARFLRQSALPAIAPLINGPGPQPAERALRSSSTSR
jgi:hypothetical protein